MLRRLHSASGLSLVELLVVVALVGIASAITLPQLTSQKDNARNRQATSTLDSAWEVAGEYYRGRRGSGSVDGAPDSYEGFVAATATALTGKLTWTDSGPDSGAMVPSASNENLVWIVPATVYGSATYSSLLPAGGVDSTQTLALCTASKTLTWCKFDDGLASGASNRLGARYGASSSTSNGLNGALGRAISRSSSCTATANQAQLLAERGSC